MPHRTSFAAGLLPVLPSDTDDAVLLGRIWDPVSGGPRPVVVKGRSLVDAFEVGETTSSILEQDDVVAALRGFESDRTWDLESLIADSAPSAASPRMLAPIDLQVIKACGVTHRTSLIERVVEQLAGGDPKRAQTVHADMAALTAALQTVEPGSAEAAIVKEALIARGIPSEYLEVGLGPDPEVFTKAPVLSAVGPGARIGIPEFSTWNNPEPELVLICDSKGTVVGASLGNDVNLRDIEGRSALLLGMAKDNNASCAVGPFIRIIDNNFTLSDVERTQVSISVENSVDGFAEHGRGNVADLLRPLSDLVAATYGAHHQYPDGFALFTGSLAVLKNDRQAPGRGFTHLEGDSVTISSKRLGALTNTVGTAELLEPWDFGITALMRYLAHERAVAHGAGEVER